MKYGDIKPRSNFNPSMTSSSSLSVFPSFTVMTPFLPTLFIADEINSPISLSPLAEIVATFKKKNKRYKRYPYFLTCAISSGVVTGFDSFFRASTTTVTAFWTPFLTSLGFAPLLTRLKPS